MVKLLFVFLIMAKNDRNLAEQRKCFDKQI